MATGIGSKGTSVSGAARHGAASRLYELNPLDLITLQRMGRCRGAVGRASALHMLRLVNATPVARLDA